MTDTRYTKDHEWASLDGGIITVGITDYAQTQLGDIVYIELPDIGRTLDQGEETAVVESVKAASDIKSPVTGEVVEINDILDSEPELVNAEPETEGWIFKIKVLDTDQFSELDDKPAYDELIKTLS